MNLNDPQFREFYTKRGLQGKRVSRAEAEALWAEFSGQQQADTEQATKLLDSVSGQASLAPSASALTQDTFAPASMEIFQPKKQDPIQETVEIASQREAQQPEKTEQKIDPATAFRDFAKNQLGPQINVWRDRRRQINAKEFRSATAKRQAFDELDGEIAETITELQMRNAWTPEADKFYGEAVKTGTPPVEAFTRTVDRLVRPQAEQTEAGLPPDRVEKVRSLQQARDAELQMADAPNVDEATLAVSRQRAASLDQQIDDVLGVKDLPWADRWNQNRTAKLDADRMEEMKGGSVNYLGVSTSFENLPALRTQISRDEANLKMEAEKNPSILLINRKNTAVLEQDPATGEPALNEAKSKEKWASMEKQLFEEGKLRVGDLIQNPISGAVEVFPGLGKAATGDKKSFAERWSPGGVAAPAMRGAQELGDQVAQTVKPYLTEKNVERAAAVADRFYPRGFVGPAIRGSAALMNDPAGTVTPVAAGVITSANPLGYLAYRGLDYLANIGRKAEEEEKKKRAGQ